MPCSDQVNAKHHFPINSPFLALPSPTQPLQSNGRVCFSYFRDCVLLIVGWMGGWRVGWLVENTSMQLTNASIKRMISPVTDISRHTCRIQQCARIILNVVAINFNEDSSCWTRKPIAFECESFSSRFFRVHSAYH